MIYTAIDTFYLTDEQLTNSPSRKDGIDEATETSLRIYGCDLIQEAGILLKLPQAVMATGQVLFHRFYCKKSFARFNVKKVAASCVWLASKLEENPRKARQVIIVFHRMECRRENLPTEFLDPTLKKYADLKKELSRTERHLLKEMGFICHVEHPHKFISNYLATLGTPPELRQEAWNLANDSLRTTLCIRFKSEVVACGVVYAAARRFQVPLPENPPWWKAFDAEKLGIDEVCRVLAHLYTLPKAQYIPVCKDGDTFTFSNKSLDSQSLPVSKVKFHGTARQLTMMLLLQNPSQELILNQVDPKMRWLSHPYTSSRNLRSVMMSPRAFCLKPLLGRSLCLDRNLTEELRMVKRTRREKEIGIGKERGKETEPSLEIGIGDESLTENVRERMQTERKSRIELIARRIGARNWEGIWRNQGTTHREILITMAHHILPAIKNAIGIIDRMESGQSSMIGGVA